jgi:hypothetical protein
VNGSRARGSQRQRVRGLLLVPLAAALIAACGATGGGSAGGGTPAQALCTSAATQVQIVVTHSSGRTRRACVDLRGASSITGEEALSRSGLGAQTEDLSFGLTVCRVDGEPASVPPGCVAQGGSYWSIWTGSPGTSWTYAQVTADKLQLMAGESLGLRYEAQSGTPTAPTTAPWRK